MSQDVGEVVIEMRDLERTVRMLPEHLEQVADAVTALSDNDDGPLTDITAQLRAINDNLMRLVEILKPAAAKLAKGLL